LPLSKKTSKVTNIYELWLNIQNPFEECTNSIKLFEETALCRKNNSARKTIAARNELLKLGRQFEVEVPQDFDE
jgi:hypothetical protein